MHLGRRPAGVEGPSYRRGSEAVDRGPAAGLHVRDEGQLARELLLERAGRDRGQVGLQQDVVDRSGEQVVERLGRVVPVDERAAERRDAVQAGDPEQRCLGRSSAPPGRGGWPTGAGAASASARRATRCRSRQPARCPRAGWPARRVRRSAARPASPGRGRGRGRSPACRRSVRPPPRPGAGSRARPARGWPSARRPSRASHASKASVGSQAASVSSVMPWSSRPAAEAVSITSAATSISTCSRAAAARRSRTASPPAFNAAGGWVPHRSRSSSVRRTSSNAAPAAARSTSACARSEVASAGWMVELPAAGHTQPEAHGPRDRHVPVVDALEQAGGHQVGGRPGATAPSSVRAGLVEVVEDRPRRRGQLVEQPGHLVGRRTRRKAQQVTDDEHRPSGRSPDQRQRLEPLHRPVDGGRGGRQVRRIGALHQRLQHGQLQGVEGVEGTEHRRLHDHPRRQLRGVVRRRSGQVGTRVEQRGQPLVGPAPELVGEGARGGRGHPGDSTRVAICRWLRRAYGTGSSRPLAARCSTTGAARPQLGVARCSTTCG